MIKFNFTKVPTKTMGLRLNVEDYIEISNLAKKHKTTKCAIASEIIKVALKEYKWKE